MIKKYSNFLLEDVIQNNLKNDNVSFDDSANTKKVVNVDNTENKKQVENNIKTETTAEVEKPKTEGSDKSAEGENTKVEGGEKTSETDNLDISTDSTKVSKYIYNFYNRLGLSLKSLNNIISRNPNDVQQKNSELKNSDVKEQPEQTTQQPEQTTQQPEQTTQQPKQTAQQSEQPTQQPEVEKDMTKRQLGFKKDSTEQLKTKLNNPLYANYKNEINTVLSNREKTETVKPKVNIKQQLNTGNTKPKTM